jgi:crotonobetainyl-CoA:carnitine CoA-transferase CaiB-like acyl-CoA transferase
MDSRAHPRSSDAHPAGRGCCGLSVAQDIVDDPHLNARGTIESRVGPEGEARKVVGPPWRLSRTPAKLDGWTPKLGEHNHYVFGQLLGLSDEEIEELIAARVIY